MITIKDALKAVQMIRTEADIEHSQLSLITDAAGVASVLVTRAGLLCEVNHTAAQMLGYLPRELEGRTLVQLLDVNDEDEYAERSLQTWLRLPQSSQIFKLSSRSGRHIGIHMAAHQLRTLYGEVSDRMVLIWIEPDRPAQNRDREHRAQTELQQLTDRLIAAHEAERKRLAQELHDGMAQALTMIKFTLEESCRMTDENKPAQGQKKLLTGIDMVRTALSDARRIAQELWPNSLDNLGLIPTINAFCRQYQDAHPLLTLDTDIFITEQDVPQSMRLDIYRVLQECLRNISQHSNARYARVILRLNSEGVLLTVKDEGVGFEADRLYYGPACLLGIGLRSMRERLQAHRGELEVQSRPGDGTTITALWRIEPSQVATPAEPDQSDEAVTTAQLPQPALRQGNKVISLADKLLKRATRTN